VLPIAQTLLALRNVAPVLDCVLPGRLKTIASTPDWLRLGAPSRSRTTPARDLNESLMRQTLESSLPVLLRYEDRNSMAWSIESRVPFLDYRLVEFLAGLPDRLKLREGTTKLVMRSGLKNILPEAIRDRRDKMGFVTPEELWLARSATPWFRQRVQTALDAAPELFNHDQVNRLIDDTVSGRAPFSFAPWRILCFGAWMSSVGEAQAAVA
jgi:asparagine synthase (glutamine-hydrolysing)